MILYTNGYEHWLWDDAATPPREVQGFLKKDELALLIERRTSRKPLAGQPVDRKIVERYYQRRAIEKVGQVFEAPKQLPRADALVAIDRWNSSASEQVA